MSRKVEYYSSGSIPNDTKPVVFTPSRSALEVTTGIYYDLLSTDKFLSGTEVGELHGAAERALNAIRPVPYAEWRRMPPEERYVQSAKIKHTSKLIKLAENTTDYLFEHDPILAVTPNVDRDNMKIALRERKKALLNEEREQKLLTQEQEKAQIVKQENRDHRIQSFRRVVSLPGHVGGALFNTMQGRFLITAVVSSGLGLGADKAVSTSGNLMSAEHVYNQPIAQMSKTVVEIEKGQQALLAYHVYDTGVSFPNGVIAKSHLEAAINDLSRSVLSWNPDSTKQSLTHTFNQIPSSSAITIFEGKNVTANSMSNISSELNSAKNQANIGLTGIQNRQSALQNHEFIEDWKAGIEVGLGLITFIVGCGISLSADSYRMWKNHRSNAKQRFN